MGQDDGGSSVFVKSHAFPVENTSPLSGGSSGPVRRKSSNTADRCFTGCRKDGSFKSIDRSSSLRIRFQTELQTVVKNRESPIGSVDSGNSDSYNSNLAGCTNHVCFLDEEQSDNFQA